jgi:hypothetical protein
VATCLLIIYIEEGLEELEEIGDSYHWENLKWSFNSFGMNRDGSLAKKLYKNSPRGLPNQVGIK